MPRLIPDRECVQGRCAFNTSGCVGECEMRRNPAMFGLPTPGAFTVTLASSVQGAASSASGAAVAKADQASGADQAYVMPPFAAPAGQHEAERAAFEKWLGSCNFLKFSDGSYVSGDINKAWGAWEARAALATAEQSAASGSREGRDGSDNSANSRAPTAEGGALELRGYFMLHKTGCDVGFSWDKDDPQFSDDWERIPAIAHPAPKGGDK